MPASATSLARECAFQELLDPARRHPCCWAAVFFQAVCLVLAAAVHGILRLGDQVDSSTHVLAVREGMRPR